MTRSSAQAGSRPPRPTKQELEKHVLDVFCQAHGSASLIEHRDAPDAIVEINGERWGIELTQYGASQDAPEQGLRLEKHRSEFDSELRRVLLASPLRISLHVNCKTDASPTTYPPKGRLHTVSAAIVRIVKAARAHVAAEEWAFTERIGITPGDHTRILGRGCVAVARSEWGAAAEFVSALDYRELEVQVCEDGQQRPCDPNVLLLPSVFTEHSEALSWLTATVLAKLKKPYQCPPECSRLGLVVWTNGQSEASFIDELWVESLVSKLRERALDRGPFDAVWLLREVHFTAPYGSELTRFI